MTDTSTRAAFTPSVEPVVEGPGFWTGMLVGGGAGVLLGGLALGLVLATR